MKKKIAKKFEHFMLEEIFEQPAISERLIARYVDFDLQKINLPEFKGYIRHLSKIKRFIFLGCGSSANASLLGNYYFEELIGKDCEYEYADEFISRRAILGPGTVVVLMSQSGKTRDVLLAAEIAKKKGAFVVGISNSPGSRLDKMSDVAINIDAGEEKGMAATKSFSAQLLVLLLMALYFADFFKYKIRDRDKIFKELEVFAKKQKEALKSEKTIIKVAKSLSGKKNLLVVGRHYNFPIALEGAHKIKETAYIHAEGIASEELRHGGAAMLDKHFAVISLAPDDNVFKHNLVLLRELNKMKIATYTFTDKNTLTLKKISTIVPLVKTTHLFSPLLTLLPLQLLAYHLAVAEGIDINNPRNIQKFVA